MKPFEPVACYCGCKSFFWGPREEKKNGTAKEDREESKNGDQPADKDKLTGDGQKKDVENPTKDAPTLSPLMQLLKCHEPCCFDGMEKRGDKLYGWVQTGFTGNLASPRDRVNYGVNFNWRSNDFRLNQAYFVVENSLELENKPNIGYRVDFVTGHDAPFLVANGLFSNFTGFDPTSGFGFEGPASFRSMNQIGIDVPQLFMEGHLPQIVTEKGIDLRAGKFYTLCGA
jgi:hypothetical protein